MHISGVQDEQQCQQTARLSNAGILFDWQIEEVDIVCAASQNVHMWEKGEVVFGGVEGVGTCAQHCPSSGEYDNVRGTVKWVPRVQTRTDNTNTSELVKYWLYTLFSVGESLPCLLYNCDESAFVENSHKHTDAVPYPDGLHPLTFFEGTSMTAFLSRSGILNMEPGCLKLNGGAGSGSQPWYDNNTNTFSFTFKMVVALIGPQRVTDFSICRNCLGGACQTSTIIPCRWQSTTDTTWWYFMYVHMPNTDRNHDPVVFQFKILQYGTQDSEYSDETIFIGHYVAGLSGSFSSAFIGDGMGTVAFVAFTSPERKCANNLPSGSWYTGAGAALRRMLLSSSNMPRRRGHNGRKVHTRQYGMGSHQHGVFIDSTTPNPPALYHTQQQTHRTGAHSQGPRRFLLNFNAAAHSATGLENTTQNNAVMRSITSINSNQRVAAAVCSGTPGLGVTCDTLAIRKEFSHD